MDTLTHALSGALLARATASKDAAPRSLPRRMAAGFIACAAPDLDFVIGLFGKISYLELHRGPTHSLILLPAWALVISWILAKVLRQPGGWRPLYGITALGILLHIAGDVITNFGTMVLWPVNDWRAALGLTFIIDLWFSGIIVAGLIFSAIFRKKRFPAVAALVVLAGYVGLQGVLKHKALEFAEEYRASRGYTGATLAAHPRPVSPFNWTVFVKDSEFYYYAHVNLVRREPRRPQPGDGFIARLDAPYLPLDQAIWVQRAEFGFDPKARPIARDAWNSPALDFFRWFAELPALDGLDERCAWFTDLRFVAPGRDGTSFPYGACRDAPDLPWRAYERTGPGRAAPLR